MIILGGNRVETHLKKKEKGYETETHLEKEEIDETLKLEYYWYMKLSIFLTVLGSVN
jgi:hypothetical protein